MADVVVLRDLTGEGTAVLQVRVALGPSAGGAGVFRIRPKREARR